jgi:preprotein translocase subunit SecG
MQNVLLVIHLIVALAMILLILIQRTAQDGGGLMGGGGTMGGMFTARGSANILSRTTAILATLFIVISLVLTGLAQHGRMDTQSITDRIAPLPASTAPAPEGAMKMPAEAEKPVASDAAVDTKDADKKDAAAPAVPLAQ